MPKRRVFVRTLGCPKNEVDGSVLERRLRKAGCEIVDDPKLADVEIVNTCGFIEPTKLESLEAIWEAVERKNDTPNEGRKLIVTGCLAQRYAAQLTEEISGIDSVVGFDRPDLILKAIDSTSTGAPACWVEKPGHTYRDDHILQEWPEGMQTPLSAYVKIADGCDNACRFCAIPLIRGKMRSRSLDSVVTEIRGLTAGGTREVILVAQDTTSWGNDLAGRPGLADLLRSINRIEGDFWIRLMYAHPAFLTDHHIDALAVCEKVVPYLDMPLQHASDRMLKTMNRHTTRKQTQERIDRLRAARPDMALRTTFIVGHPGETDEDFARLLEFAEENVFERMGVFAYSPEDSTPSAQLSGQVPVAVARERVERLTESYDHWSAEQAVDMVGRTISCLIERSTNAGWEGRTIYDAPEIDGRIVLTGTVPQPGVYNVSVTGALGIDLIGSVRKRNTNRNEVATPLPEGGGR